MGASAVGLCISKSEVRLYIMPCRKVTTLQYIILRSCSVGSVITSDEWKEYYTGNRYGFLNEKQSFLVVRGT